MTPKEKAEQLLNRFYFDTTLNELEASKECALIAVDEMINCLNDDDLYIQGESNIDGFINFYKEVKLEIEKL